MSSKFQHASTQFQLKRVLAQGLFIFDYKKKACIQFSRDYDQGEGLNFTNKNVAKENIRPFKEKERIHPTCGKFCYKRQDYEEQLHSQS